MCVLLLFLRGTREKGEKSGRVCVADCSLTFCVPPPAVCRASRAQPTGNVSALHLLTRCGQQRYEFIFTAAPLADGGDAGAQLLAIVQVTSARERSRGGGGEVVDDCGGRAGR